MISTNSQWGKMLSQESHRITLSWTDRRHFLVDEPCHSSQPSVWKHLCDTLPWKTQLKSLNSFSSGPWQNSRWWVLLPFGEVLSSELTLASHVTLPAEIPTDGWLSHGSDTRVGSQRYHHSTVCSELLTYTLILCMDDVRASPHTVVHLWGREWYSVIVHIFLL